MREITQTQFENIKRSRPWAERTGILKEILELSPGEGRIINKSEWTYKRDFQVAIHSLARSQFVHKNEKMQFRCKTLPDGSGWAVLRSI